MPQTLHLEKSFSQICTSKLIERAKKVISASKMISIQFLTSYRVQDLEKTLTPIRKIQAQDKRMLDLNLTSR